ncbi:MAG: response regulator transcription factor [Chloroflexota bacterium]
MDKIRVMVIDEQTFFRAGLMQALSKEANFEVTECDPLQDPAGSIENTLTDIVLIGSDLTTQSALELSRVISRSYPNTKVILMSPNPDDNELFQAMKAAAVAYLNKNTNVTEIADTIKRAYRGEYPINDSLVARPRVAGEVLEQFKSTKSLSNNMDTIAASLTRRETEILNYIANGNSNKQIADILEISEQTIKNHISSILRKLNANDRAHAVVLAIRHGWISVEDMP